MKGKWTFIGSLLAVALLALAVGSGQAQGPQPPAPGVEPQGEAGILASLGTAFTYQGQLKSGSNPVNGTCDFQFALYDAASGGTSLGTQTKTGVSVTNGLFTIPDLDFGAGAFQGDARWLQIAVRCPAGSGSYTTLAPRQALTATPYALGLRPGAQVVGPVTADPYAVIYARNTDTSGTTYGVFGQSASTAGTGVFGLAGATSGTTYGVFGQSASTAGTGVFGLAGATSGTTYGVLGQSASTAGRGVVGYASATSGTTYGVAGQSNSTAGRGVYGLAGAANGTTYGVYGESASTDGRGVYGLATATSGWAYGVYGESASTDGRGVLGWATAASGTTYGVWGESASTAGRGVYGYATATSGITYGVYGQSASTAGTGVYGLATATSGWTYGVRGEIAGTGGVGVYGWATATSGYAYGVVGESDSANGYGGYFYNGANGVALCAEAETTGDVLRVYGSNGSDIEFRVQGNGEVYADGNFHSGGADYAELLPGVEGLQPGDVLVIGPDGRLTRSTRPYQTSVVGVYSTRPGFLGGAGDDADPTGKIPLAIMGVVPVKASAENGPIRPGDLLVASATPGHAMRAGPNPPQGTVIGKALEGLEKGTGVIQMLVVLQ